MQFLKFGFSKRGLVALALKRWKRVLGLGLDLSLLRVEISKGFTGKGEEEVLVLDVAVAMATEEKWQFVSESQREHD